MKLSKRITLAALAGLFTFTSAPTSRAFMMETAEVATAEGSTDITQVVDQLREELKADKTTCADMLAKIDAAIERIDASLEVGVADETKHLALRDELVEMRLSLPCLGQELAQGPSTDGAIISDTVVSEQVIEERRVGGAPAGSGSGGGGGAGGGAGGGLGGLGPAAVIGGVAAAIAIPLAVSDNPGNAASGN